MPAALAACGDDSNKDTGQQPASQSGGEAAEDAGGGAPAQGVREVTIKEFKFSPDPVEVKVGQRVLWRNEDSAPHTATAEGKFDSKKMAEGASFEFTPEAEHVGTIAYVCTIHPSMKGTLEVAEQ
jgi:plastocyanin